MIDKNFQVLSLLENQIKVLLDQKGFKRLTEPQLEAIPEILKGENVLLVAPTGTGKTEAALIPILQMMLKVQGKIGIKLIYITPLRALNRDLLDRISWWCNKLNFRVGVRHGDTSSRERRTQALHPPDILITTPETFQILLNGRLLRRSLETVKWVIIDEIHEIAESKRGVQLTLNLEKLRFLLNRDFQIIGLSATVGSPKKIASLLVGVGRSCKIVYVPVAKRMKLEVRYPIPTKEDCDLAEQLYTFPEVAARLREIRELIEQYKSALIFTNTRPTAEALGSRFKLWDFKIPVEVHHGSLSVVPRVRAERGLKLGELKAVVCTSSLELGIDIGNIELCIQYGSPRQITRLIQRVGRSGHKICEISNGVVIAQDPDDALESIVITKYAREEKLEEPEIFTNCLDVLSHFIAGLLILRPRWKLTDIYNMVKKSFSYKDFGIEQLRNLVSFLSSLSQRFLIYYEDSEEISSGNRRRLYRYFHENLSMIPEVKQYLVINDEDNLPIGVLDESFVTEFGEIGVKFIIAGEVWKIKQIFRDRVYVTRETDPEGAIPSWVGEEIPVSFEVAQEVGRIRGKVEEMYRRGINLERIVADLSSLYGCDKNVLKEAILPTWMQIRKSLPVPTDKRIILEKYKDMIIIHAHFGTRVNRTLSRYLAERISHELGITVSSHNDPYRIYIKSPEIGIDDVINILNLEIKDLESMIRATAEKTSYFRFRIGHIARRMGVITKDTELSRQLVDQLISIFRGTPLFEETINEVVTKDLDLKNSVRVLEMIRRGEIRVISLGEVGKPTPIAENGIKWMKGKPEYVTPDRARVLAIASTRARILSQIRTFLCIECLNFLKEMRVYEFLESSVCPNCLSRKIAILKEPEEEIIEILHGSFPTKQKERFLQEAKKISELVEKYGKPAIIVLSSEIESIDKAKEILSKEPRLTGRLYELIVRAEKEQLLKSFEKRLFARFRRFRKK